MNYGTDSSAAATQFDAWSREERSVREAVAKAERELAFVDQRLSSLRMEQQQLSNQTRESSDALGHFHSERGLLVKENERHIQLLNADRSMLEESVLKSEEMSHYETEEKAEFCKETEALNEELAMLLTHQEDRRLKKLVSNETISALLTFIEASPVDEMAMATAEWKNVCHSAEESIKQYEKTKHQIVASRIQALQQQTAGSTGLTLERLLEMEFGWYDQSAGKTDHDGDMRDKAGTFYEQFPASQEESDA